MSTEMKKKRKRRKRLPKTSKGEKDCGYLLIELGFQPLTQVIIPALPKYFYDFGFMVNGRMYIVEFDGDQHFQYVKFIHRRQSVYVKRFRRDVLKTLIAILSGFYFIRIDSQCANVREQILLSIASEKRLSVSNPDRYMGMLSLSLFSDEVAMYSSHFQSHIPLHLNLSPYI